MFASESPQEPLPYGRWGDALGEQFASAAPEGTTIDSAGIVWFPERTWGGRTYVPATAAVAGGEGAQANDFTASSDFTEETAAENPDWTLDLSDEEIGQWRGTEGRRGIVTLVWGVALVPNGIVATTELGPTTTDQCELVEDRFTLVSLDAYTGDYVEVRLYGARGAELARESLYEDE